MGHTLPSQLQRSFDKFSTSTALVQCQASGKATAYSFRDLQALASKVLSLLGQDIDKQACIGLYMQRSANHVASIVASLHLGLAYTTINNLASPRQVSHIVRDGNLRILLCDNATLLKLRAFAKTAEAQQQLSKLKIVHIRPDKQLPKVHAQTITLLNEFGSVESVCLDDLGEGELAVPVPTSEGTPSVILFTSGSTGSPKGVMVSESNLLQRVESESKAYRLKRGDVLLSMLPFSFDVGCNQLYSSLLHGCCLVLLNSWMPKDIVSAIIDHSVMGVSGVPSLWQSVLDSDSDALAQANRKLRYITISGGDMADKDRLALRSIFPDVEIFKTYGQTESFRSTMLRSEDFDTKHHTVGKPVDGVKLHVLDESGLPQKPGTIGEVVHEGAGTMLGYVGDRETTDNKLRPLPTALNETNSKAIYTGDLGLIDENGFLRLYGRRDRMFKVRGNRVYPEEIERELCAHEEVLEAVCSFVKTREQIDLYVRKATDSSLTNEDVTRFLAPRLPPYMMPSKIAILDEFPRTSSAKIDIPALLSSND